MVFIAFLLLVAGWIAISSVSKIDANVAITPTIIVSDRNYLPYVHGLEQGPTTTATHPPPTMTPWVTLTPSPTATDSFDPAPKNESTPEVAGNLRDY